MPVVGDEERGTCASGDAWRRHVVGEVGSACVANGRVCIAVTVMVVQCKEVCVGRWRC